MKFGLKSAASDFQPPTTDVAFELLLADAFRRQVAATLNAGQNGINVRLLRAGYETGKFHVVDETLT